MTLRHIPTELEPTRPVRLSEETKLNNAIILARIARAEKELFKSTRQLQRDFREQDTRARGQPYADPELNDRLLARLAVIEEELTRKS